MKNFNTNSNYWIGNLTGSLDDAWWREDDADKPKGKDLVALAGYKKAISNFVNIVTTRSDIPVVYNSKGGSYTNGKKVVLSGRMNDKNFDSSVGLALHEGSHIVHTDFDLLKDIRNIVREELKLRNYTWEERQELAEHTRKVKDLLNYVEDRRIDYIIFKSAPGYKNYYHAMYKKYFEFKVINKALKTGQYTDDTSYDSYEFRIINFLNQFTDLDALPGLREIYKTINFKNISRLNNTREALDVALEMYKIILANLKPAPKVQQPDDQQTDDDQQESAQDGDTSDSESSTSNNASSSEDPNSDSPSEQLTEASDETADETADETSANKPVELSDKEKKSLAKAIEQQKAFTSGAVKKSNLTKKDNQTLKAVEDSQAYTQSVGTKSGKTDCIVVPRLTKSMIPKSWGDGAYNFLRFRSDDYLDRAIQEGIVLGKRLGKKLQVRNESRETKWTRQDSGRIDKRLIAELGFDNRNVFSQVSIDKYNDAFIHISVDASGSMSGDNWNNAMKSAAAIAQASSMCGNIHVQVSIRTTQSTGKDHMPIIAIIYDSNVNKIIHIKQIWKFLTAGGTTPEGLCFEAIEKQILKDANGRDSYFLNLSDGQPYFSTKSFWYSGDSAYSHTRSKVDNFKKAGIKVLSFFITSGYYQPRDGVLSAFKTMYGKDAVTIDPTSLVSLAKVLNAKFLEA